MEIRLQLPQRALDPRSSMQRVEFWEGLISLGWETQSELQPRFSATGDVRCAECSVCCFSGSTEKFYKYHAPEFCCMRITSRLAKEQIVNDRQMLRFLSLDREGGWRKRKPVSRIHAVGTLC